MSEGFFKIVANNNYRYMSGCTVDAGGGHAVAVEYINGTNSKTWAWGVNNSLQISRPASIEKRILPGCVSNSGTKDFTMVSAGDSHNIAIDIGSTGWTWGSGANGILGDNSTTSKSTPVAICGGHAWSVVSAGFDHSLGVDQSIVGWGWGLNTYGQIGDNTTTSKLTPVSVKNFLGFTAFLTTVSAGYYHSLAEYYDGGSGTFYPSSWGYNLYGQLGDNSTTNRSHVVAVCGGHSILQISAGQYHSVLIDTSNLAWGWGVNFYGQIGDNTTTSRLTPVAICGGHSFCYISAGYGYTLAIDTTGQTWGWGLNSSGELGDNTTVSRLTPVAVCGGHSFISVSAGNAFSLGLTANGAVWAWGDNTNGKLGVNDNITSSTTPLRVCGF